MKGYGNYPRIPVGVDIHVHDREPSPLNQSETFRSGSEAGVRGGWGARVNMPNVQGYETWYFDRAQEQHRRIGSRSLCYMGIFVGSQENSNNHPEFGPLLGLGLGTKLYLGPTTGTEGQKTFNLGYYWETAALHNRLEPDKPVLFHRGNVPVEEIIDNVTKRLGQKTHICHESDPAAVEVIGRAKKEGLPITCGITPHHVFMDSHDEFTKGWFASMQPPLAPQPDAEKLWRQLVDGDIDIMETDHAPHSVDSKWQAELENPHHEEGSAVCYGVPGSEFAIPQLLNQERRGTISLKRIVEATSTKPAEIIGISMGTQTYVIWSRTPYQIDKSRVISGATMTPYEGNLAVGEVREMKLAGRFVVAEGDITEVKIPNRVLIKGQLI